MNYSQKTKKKKKIKIKKRKMFPHYILGIVMICISLSDENTKILEI